MAESLFATVYVRGASLGAFLETSPQRQIRSNHPIWTLKYVWRTQRSLLGKRDATIVIATAVGEIETVRLFPIMIFDLAKYLPRIGRRHGGDHWEPDDRKGEVSFTNLCATDRPF